VRTGLPPGSTGNDGPHIPSVIHNWFAQENSKAFVGPLSTPLPARTLRRSNPSRARARYIVLMLTLRPASTPCASICRSSVVACTWG
jgi:hypothetical protein